MENKPEKLILDYSRWRCGEEGRYKVGEGKVALKNTQGYMCCLGQWSLQLGATEEEILRRGEPNEINTLIPLFVDVEIEYGETIMHTNKLAYKCININDNDETTPDEKIFLLQELLGTHGIELEVINKPNDNK